MKSITLLDIGMAEDGHRASYVSFLSSLFPLERMGFCRRAVFSRRPVLVPMIEESFFIYIATAVIRSLMGRSTVGFLFRPLPALHRKGVRLKAKYLLLRLLRKLPHVTTLTILPFELEPRFAEIAGDWIHDPQLWDLDEQKGQSAPPSTNGLLDQLHASSGGKPICMAIGRQDKSKGFDWFCSLFAEDRRLRESMLFAFGGKVSQDMAAPLESFTQSGGFACNRFVSDDELMQLYAGADLVWCAYDANYDQASGIFGRAVQLGIPVVARKGSLIHRQCLREGIPCVAIGSGHDWESLSQIPPREPLAVAQARTRRMRDESLQTLHKALGLRP
jgi:hypothetical protein